MKSIANLCRTGLKSKTTAIIGAQWGDEGKGKLTDILSEHYDICARFNGGDNAGHTIVVGGNKFFFHALPSGMLNKNTLNVIGNGVVLNLNSLKKELDMLESKKVDYNGRLLISDRAHLTLQCHIEADKGQETESGKDKMIGTTQKGIGPTYATKMRRTGLRVCDLSNMDSFKEKYTTLCKSFGKTPNDYPGELEFVKQMREFLIKNKMITDTVSLMNKTLKDNKRILLEGANATLLDIDFGTYPYVTSSNTSIGGVCTGLGVPPSQIETVIGICKAYNTRVGSGPFPTECIGEDAAVGEDMGQRGHEFGVTTGRKRRVGWFDVNVLKYSHMVNGFSSINITKLDIFSPLKQLKIGVGYKKKDGTLYTGAFPASLEELGEMECIWEVLPGYLL